MRKVWAGNLWAPRPKIFVKLSVFVQAVLGVKLCEIFRFGHRNLGKQSTTPNFTTPLAEKRGKMFTPRFCWVAALTSYENPGVHNHEPRENCLNSTERGFHVAHPIQSESARLWANSFSRDRSLVGDFLRGGGNGRGGYLRWAKWGRFVIFPVFCLLAYGDTALKS